MSVAPREFWSRLVRAGITDANGCQQFAESFAKHSQSEGQSEDTPAAENTLQIAKFLLQQGVLTRYQADLLSADEEVSLRVGAFVIANDQPTRPLTHWLPVQTTWDCDADATRQGFLLRVPLSGLSEDQRHWLAIHSEISTPTLQSLELTGGAQGQDNEQTVEIFSPLPTGMSLWKVLQSKKKLSARKTIRIGVDAANALQAMHASGESQLGISHGAVGIDHLWVTAKGHAVLLRDPSAPPRSPHADLSASWIERIEPAANNAAPELVNTDVQPTPQSDIYALGCTLFSILTGRAPFPGNTPEALLAAHQSGFPPELEQAVEQGAGGDPLFRVLAYAMAKDPKARFDSAAAFSQALTRAADALKHSGQDPLQADIAISEPAPAASETGAQSASKTESRKPKAESPKPEGKAPPIETANLESPKKPDTAKLDTAKLDTAKLDTAKLDTAKPDVVMVATPPPPPTQVPKIETAPAAVKQDEFPVEPPEPPAGAPTADNDESSSSPGNPSCRKRRKRKKSRVPLFIGMISLPLMLLALAIALRGKGPVKRTPPPRLSAGTKVPSVGKAFREDAVVDQSDRQTETLVNGYQLVDSDRLLWVPPYPADSKPPSLELLPPGPAGIASFAVADLLAKPAAVAFKQAFGPETKWLVQAAVNRSGVPAENLKRCTVALFPGVNGRPEVAFSVELVNPVPIAELSAKWNAFESRTADGNSIYAGDEPQADAYFLGDSPQGKPDAEQKVSRFAVATLERIREVAENDGGTIPLVRSMQTLWNKTSQQSDVVLLLTPNFLFADGRQLIQNSVPEARDVLKQWLFPDVSMMSFSATLVDNSLYFELREIPSGNATPASLLKSFRDRVDGWSTWGDRFVIESNPDASWKLLASRLPLMLRFVAQQTRSTIEDEMLVASSYLPADAGAQVALATTLAMNTPRGGTQLAASGATKALSVDEMLQRPMSISFLQLSLQFAAEAVVDEFGQSLPEGNTMPKVRIIGGDLEKNGITQNQQIRGFERSDVPLRSVLTDLVLGANPDKTATGPSDVKQSLVWVIHPQGKPPGETEILITTRDAAKDKYELPVEFQPSE